MRTPTVMILNIDSHLVTNLFKISNSHQISLYFFFYLKRIYPNDVQEEDSKPIRIAVIDFSQSFNAKTASAHVAYLFVHAEKQFFNVHQYLKKKQSSGKGLKWTSSPGKTYE